jgi:hypothetical protein
MQRGEFLPHENLRRLKKALKGEAFKLVEGKMHLPDNVDAIIKDLQQLYGNKYNSIDKWIKKLRALPGAKQWACITEKFGCI